MAGPLRNLKPAHAAVGLAVLCALFLQINCSYARDVSGRFDYYVLILSWSPAYCETASGQRNQRQCGAERRYSFVVHGLWPQYNKGWPGNCDVSSHYVSNGQIAGMLSIMPSKKLVIHQWRKHGSCSGLSQPGYFDLTRELFSRILVPARYISPTRPILVSPGQIVADFVKTNSWLTAEMMAVHCGASKNRAVLTDLRFCSEPDGRSRKCGLNERRTCRAEKIVMPPVR